MPQTFNGVGTWYYGSKSSHSREDTCEQCGNYTTLRSYDTTKYFVVVYIPLIPLGRFRVVDDCQACRRHLAIPLKEWEARRDEEVEAASRDLESDPWNVENARTLVQACAAYHYHEGLERHEARAQQALSNDATGMAFLASAYDYLGEPDKAEEAYRKSLRLQDDVAVRETLGLLLIKHEKPEEAKDYLWHLTTPGSVDNDPLLYFLVEAYQAKGLHQAAGQVLSAMQSKNPALAGDELFRKYRSRVQRRLGSTRPVASPLMRGKELGYDGSRHLWVTAVVIVLIVATLSFFLFQRTQRVDVYVVNGLEKSYGVVIDGERHDLPPKGRIEVTTRRGRDVVAEAVEAELGWPSRVPLAVSTSFWASLFDDTTYVLNPDETALLVWEQNEYRVNPIEKEIPTRLHYGTGFYVFPGVDYEFRDFPDTIQMSASTVVEFRERIWQATDLDPMDVYNAATGLGALERFDEYLIARLRAYPDDGTALSMAGSFVPIEAFVDLAEPRLAARPLEIEWHRTYQSTLELAGENEALLERYQALLEAEPEDPDLKYLCARVTDDDDASEELLREATAADPASPYAFYALAFRRLSEGDFDEALVLSREARKLAPEVAELVYAEDEALLALERYDVLLESNRALREAEPMLGEPVAEAVRLSVAKGDTEGARELIDAYMHRIYETESDTAAWKNYLESVYHLGLGHWKSYIERASAIDEPRFQFQSALASGNHRAAIAAIRDTEAGASDYLLAYLAARRGKDPEAAQEYLEAGLVELSALYASERRLAACLEGEAPTSAMYRLSLRPELKAVGLAVLAERTGDARLRRLAKQLNYHLSFERYYLDASFF